MLNPILRVLFCFGAAFHIMGAAFAEAPPIPATAIRWDKSLQSNDPEPATGPKPQSYTLSLTLGSPGCFDVDEVGRIYVVDAARQVINRYNALGVLDKQWVDGIHYAGQSISRGTIRVAPDERIFLGYGAYNYDVRRIGPNPNDNKLFPIDPHTSNSIMPGKDGAFFIDVMNYNEDRSAVTKSQMLAYSAEGKLVRSWDMPPIQTAAMGPDGLIYVAPTTGWYIEVWDQSGKRLRKINLVNALGGIGGGDDQRNPIRQMCVDINGDIYLTQLSREMLHRIDKDGNPIARWNPYDSRGVSSIAVRNGLVYALLSERKYASAGVKESWQTAIHVYSPSGQCLMRYQNGVKPALDQPIMIAVQPDGWYGILEQDKRQAQLFDAEGKQHDFSPQSRDLSYLTSTPGGGFLASEWGKLIKYDGHGENGEVIYPESAKKDPTSPMQDAANMQQPAYDPVTGDIWGLGWSGIVTHLNANGQIIKEFPKSKPLCFRTFSVGTVVNRKGYMYVPNSWGHCILKVDQDGKIVQTIGKEGSALGELRYPEGLALDSQDRLYVADSGNSRIQVFDSEGKPLGFYGARGAGDGQFDRPYGVTLAPDNVIWVADTFNDRIVKIALPDLLKKLNLEAKPEVVVQAPKKAPTPVAGKVTVRGIVVAGTDDFADMVYVEDGWRVWAIEAVLPQSEMLKRGVWCTLTGTLTLKDKTSKHLDVDTIDITEPLGVGDTMPAPLGMANMYVGDGYRNGNKAVDLSNLAMLVRTWGKVVSVDKGKKLFVINDGSFLNGGLVVRVDYNRSASFVWPTVGHYVSVTGISVSWNGDDGKPYAGIRVREQDDVSLLDAGKPTL